MARIDTVRGTESFRFRFRLQGKTIIYSLDDVLESYVGTHDLISRRFVQDFAENDKPKHRRYEIFPDSGYFREEGHARARSPRRPTRSTMRPSSISCGSRRSRSARSTSISRYFRKEKNPVTIEVTKREKMELPDGSRSTAWCSIR